MPVSYVPLVYCKYHSSETKIIAHIYFNISVLLFFINKTVVIFFYELHDMCFSHSTFVIFEKMRGKAYNSQIQLSNVNQLFEIIFAPFYFRIWWTLTGNFGSILPIDWTKSCAKGLQHSLLNLNQNMVSVHTFYY